MAGTDILTSAGRLVWTSGRTPERDMETQTAHSIIHTYFYNFVRSLHRVSLATISHSAITDNSNTPNCTISRHTMFMKLGLEKRFPRFGLPGPKPGGNPVNGDEGVREGGTREGGSEGMRE